jgi:IS605 OrfB family transposase
VYARIADRRRDHLHQETTRLVRENQTVVIEDLAVRNMVKNRTLARAISDASWRELRSMLEYKSRWYGRELRVVDRFFPSSRLCSVRGTVAGSLPVEQFAASSLPVWSVHSLRPGDREVWTIRQQLRYATAIVVVMTPEAQDSDDITRMILEGQWRVAAGSCPSTMSASSRARAAWPTPIGGSGGSPRTTREGCRRGSCCPNAPSG